MLCPVLVQHFNSVLTVCQILTAQITRYTQLQRIIIITYVFVPIAVGKKLTMGAINSDGLEFLGDLGRRITQVTDDIRESAFLSQRLSVLIQRYNAVAIQGTFAHTTSEDEF